MAQAHKNRLLQLIQRKDEESVKAYLETLPETEKGKLFEKCLAELFKGNGWLVESKGGRGDRGADILLYHPKTPDRVALIIQAKNHAKPLTFDETKLELIKFEEQAAPKYNCRQYNLFAVNGFVKEAHKLSEFNMLLSDWEYVTRLIERYDPDKIVEPEIELYAHNKNTYQRANELWLHSNYVAVVQATGTGKSFLIAKVMIDFLDENKLVMAPSNYILDQQKSRIPWATQSTTFMTYAKAPNLTTKKINALKPKLIVLDEFHRCGAAVWGKGVQRILGAHPNAYVFGTTATPIRYLDDARDMSYELFGGVVAEDLSLAEAIVRRILPAPDYIAALYTLDEEIEDLLETLEAGNKTDEEKKEIKTEIQQAKLNWEKTSGIPEILKKHLTPDINKFIVFCRNEEHLDEMEWVVESWFQKAKLYKRRKKYRVISSEPESDKNLEAFKKAKSKDTAHLLFAIDMLNEGLHISDVGAVILLRPTESPIVFYQQIGRCIQVDSLHTPIIFDFVNNFQSIRAKDFLQALDEAKEQEREKRTDLGLEEYTPTFHISDDTKEILEVFENISERLQPWEVMFQQLMEYKKQHGDCNVPDKWEGNKKLAHWVGNQRQNKARLSTDKVERLNNIGFDWTPLDTVWEQMFTELVAFKEKFGHCKVAQRWKENKQLATWVSEQRHSKEALSPKRVSKLDAIGFDWNPHDTYWEQRFAELVAFKEKFGHCNVPRKWKENEKLATWIGTQRQNKSRLSPKQVKKLDAVGFDWNPIKTQWEKMYAELVAFKERFGHCNVPDRWDENKKLATWVNSQRQGKSRLSPKQLNRLTAIGFDWNPLETAWEKSFAKLLAFKERFGHCNVPTRWKENEKLASWVGTQRQKKGILSPERVSRLDSIDFDWNPYETYWEKMFRELMKYKKRFGDCNVPNGWKENRKLATWVINQRHRKAKLSPDQVSKLNNIGFDWNPYETAWEQRFAELMAFKEKFGHCNVPRKWKENEKLATWIGTQRQKKSTLLLGQVSRLDAVGFDWNPLDTLWESMFVELVAYKEKFTDCNVPRKWQDNPKLGRWVSAQREFKKQVKLTSERIKRLDELGFEWEPSKKKTTNEKNDKVRN